MIKKICIFGTGGSGRETLCCLMYSIAGTGKKIGDIACFMVDDEYFSDTEIMGIAVIPKSRFDMDLHEVVVSIGDSALRKKIVESFPKFTKFATIIHPSVIMSQWVEIGEGSIITAGCILTCNIKIGKHAQLNLATTIGHDFVANDYFTTAQGVNVSGNCTFGECVYLGANAAVREKISLCDNVTIGMGGIVVKNINESGVFVGNPVKRLLKK